MIYRDARVHELIHRGRPSWSAGDLAYVRKWMTFLRQKRDEAQRELAKTRDDLWALVLELDGCSVAEGDSRMAVLQASMDRLTKELAASGSMPSEGPCTPECAWATSEIPA